MLIIAIIWTHKYMYGFSPVGYIYNFYYNIYRSEYKIKPNFPKFFWRIVKSDNKKIVYESFLVDDKVISATLDDGYKNKPMSEIERMCEGKNNIVKMSDEYTILCLNENNTYLSPYKIVYSPNSYFLFMYDYSDKYDWVYKKLIDYIREAKRYGDNDNPPSTNSSTNTP